jgi:hypothetical protein
MCSRILQRRRRHSQSLALPSRAPELLAGRDMKENEQRSYPYSMLHFHRLRQVLQHGLVVSTPEENLKNVSASTPATLPALPVHTWD